MTLADAFPAPVVLWSKPEEARAGKPLLVLLHGYGANEQDLLSLADMLPDDFAVASVRAPIAMGPGFSWFPLTGSIEYSVDAVKAASAYVLDWLDTVKEFRDAELDGTVPLFWGRDQQDPVITPDKIEYTMGWVRKHVKLTKVLYTGMWHGINAQEVGHVSEFLTHEVLNK
jgi:phospholipase/carboxylesterase